MDSWIGHQIRLELAQILNLNRNLLNYIILMAKGAN